MNAGAVDAADVLDDGFVRDEHVRRALEIDVDEATLGLAEEQLESCRPAIESFFATRLGPREGPNLLRYREGDFYGPHRDRAEAAAWPGAALRRIAVVLFLNTSRDGDPDGEFAGGALRIFSADGSSSDLQPREGTVVAFPADTLHEVTPVREGVRDAIVDWFYDAQ